ncbi:MAG TPA: adenylosuccinate synthetase [Gemmataceae bacterium]|nr:adenylosuccinate synthetase [Gemmataceae bacterium]
MKRAIITVGLGFGDEGKGATVDYLTRKYEADLVVRYCGGSQAGHNVQLPDGRRHTFSQFGAGTLAADNYGGKFPTCPQKQRQVGNLPPQPARPRTYLGPHVIIDPLAMAREAEHLSDLGVHDPARRLTIHSQCLVTTPWLKILNQLRELSRGAAKHGSCGQGIGEARSYWLKNGADAVFAADLRQPDVLRHKLELQRQRILLELQDFIDRISDDALQEFGIWDLNTEAIACDLHEALPPEVTVDAALPEFQTAIFEGAQGILLDEYRGFHPHTTWNTVTPHHAWELIHALGVEAVAVLGITRAYTTRHGEGPLPTFNRELTARLQDAGNPWNPWQGSLRCGWLDLPLLRYAAAVAGTLDGIVVNHLDQMRGSEWLICEAYRDAALSPATAPHLAWQSRLTEALRQAEPVLSPATPESILRSVSEIAPLAVTGFGPSYEDRCFTELVFRKHREELEPAMSAVFAQASGRASSG